MSSVGLVSTLRPVPPCLCDKDPAGQRVAALFRNRLFVSHVLSLNEGPGGLEAAELRLSESAPSHAASRAFAWC